VCVWGLTGPVAVLNYQRWCDVLRARCLGRQPAEIHNGLDVFCIHYYSWRGGLVVTLASVLGRQCLNNTKWAPISSRNN